MTINIPNNTLSAIDIVEMIKAFIKNYDHPIIYVVYSQYDIEKRDCFIKQILRKVSEEAQKQYTQVDTNCKLATGSNRLFDLCIQSAHNILVLGTKKQSKSLMMALPPNQTFYTLEINEETCNFDSARFW